MLTKLFPLLITLNIMDYNHGALISMVQCQLDTLILTYISIQGILETNIHSFITRYICMIAYDLTRRDACNGLKVSENCASDQKFRFIILLFFFANSFLMTVSFLYNFILETNTVQYIFFIEVHLNHFLISHL